MDTISKEKRSHNMAAIKAKNTKPEIIVRKYLHAQGFRFRIHRNDLPGKPDIVLSKYKVIIFVHGCFWHQHKGCKRSNIPKSNNIYWVPKLVNNVYRDKENIKLLKKNGWEIIVIWECEIKKNRMEAKLRKITNER
ncbi:MAG: DNA mismatch endonuclease Vsr [Melioribacteraceae bacterium]|nr:DNA mismatch endonuclease Vsr [Melioribacteraceae bacterium]